MVNFIWENIFKRADQEKNISAILSENLIFKDLTKRELKFVENIVHIRHYHAGENVFRQGEVGIGMYILVKGSVDILVFEAGAGQDLGKEVFLTRLGVGDFFGELSLVEDNGPRSATARSYEDSILIGFFRPDLLEILDRSPSTGVKILFRLGEVLGRRLKETTDKISQLRKELRAMRHQRTPNANDRTPDGSGSKTPAT
jgi:CRP-like cAMP-binding protein